MNWWEQRAAGEVRPSRPVGRPSVSRIRADLLIGEYPRAEDIGWLKETFDITAVHSLQDDEDLSINGLDLGKLREHCRSHGIRFVRTPISDGSADHMRAHLARALDDLHELIEANERVYLHCNAGMNRAPTLAIAYLRARGGMSLDEALAHVRRHRACGPFMMVLEEFFGPRDFKPES